MADWEFLPFLLTTGIVHDKRTSYAHDQSATRIQYQEGTMRRRRWALIAVIVTMSALAVVPAFSRGDNERILITLP
jgi:hypothetical protein